jgi:hypothetical protein
MIVWIQGHMEMVVAIVKANSIFQLVVGALKKMYELAKGKEKPAA